MDVLGIERRLLSRVLGTTIGPVQVRADETDVTFSVGVVDFSILGIGLEAPSHVAPGTWLIFETGPRGTLVPKELAAQVMHATPSADARWVLGCRFSRFMTVDDVTALG